MLLLRILKTQVFVFFSSIACFVRLLDNTWKISLIAPNTPGSVRVLIETLNNKPTNDERAHREERDEYIEVQDVSPLIV